MFELCGCGPLASCRLTSAQTSKKTSKAKSSKSKTSKAKSSKSKTSNAAADCGTDPWTSKGSTNGKGTGLDIRPDHPRLIAPAYKWNCLPKMIAADSYLSKWHSQIMSDANKAFSASLVTYVYDGGPSGSGVLDPARQVQMRIKLFAYAWRFTKDSKWVSRAWDELYVRRRRGRSNQADAVVGHVR